MNKEFNNIEIKMRALGYSQQQIESIIKDSLYGKPWGEMNSTEKKQVLQSLDSRVELAKKFLKFLNCPTCWKENL